MNKTDVELVIMAKVAGDSKAFAVLVRRHQAPLRAFLRKVCADASLADDLAQEALLKAHKALASFQGGGSFRSWLFSIAYREFLQSARKAKTNARIEDALKSDAAQAEHITSPESGLSLDLQRALDSLEVKERASVLLCDAVGFSHAEAATALNLPLGSLKTYIARARQKLREAMTAETTANNSAMTKTPKKGNHYAF